LRLAARTIAAKVITIAAILMIKVAVSIAFHLSISPLKDLLFAKLNPMLPVFIDLPC
jgi:hypothetical protein